MSIPGVKHESRGVDHEDHRRTLLTAFNGDLGTFAARQVKFAVMKEDGVLGGHFHDYDELFYLLAGQGVFTLKDPANEFVESHPMFKGDRLFIPRGIAHKAIVKTGSILVGCTEQPYVSPEHNDHKYEF